MTMLEPDYRHQYMLPGMQHQAQITCMYHNGYAANIPNIDRGYLVDGTVPAIYDSSSPSQHSGAGSSPSTCYQHSPGAQPSPEMIMYEDNTAYQLNRFWHEKVLLRRLAVKQSVDEIVPIIHSLLKQVEAEEPRFTCTLKQTQSGKYDGLIVETPTQFQVLLYLNHMAVFNFVDEGSAPGCAALKLSDGRKRSMSLWVEFITASGFLSARKIRSKFQSLVAAILEKEPHMGVRMLTDSNDVILIIKDTYSVQISPAFSWKGTWPRCVGNWAMQQQLPWPTPQMANESIAEGITLVSQESAYMRDKQASSEGDGWIISYSDAEDRLLYNYGLGRLRVLSIVKCLRDRHLDMPGGCTVTNYHLKTLVLYECEKHPHESEWDECCYGDRVNSIFLQLIACLQSNCCPHYLHPRLDLFKAMNKRAMAITAKAAWAVVREMVMNKACFDRL